MTRREAFIKFVSTIDEPIQPTPTHETRAERKVRLLEDTLERLKLCEKAKMLQDMNDVHFHLQFRIERMLVDARRDVKFERGQF